MQVLAAFMMGLTNLYTYFGERRASPMTNEWNKGSEVFEGFAYSSSLSYSYECSLRVALVLT